MPLKHTIEEMRQIAKERGGECLSTEYKNNYAHLRWKCKEGHEWEAIPKDILRNRWCKICGRKKAAEKKKRTIEQMEVIAKQNGGKCLSNVYIHGHTHLKWECSEGHQWMATPNNIQQGKWCPKCVGVIKHTLDDAKKAAIERGGECLSSEYKNEKAKMIWKCSEGHVWKAALNNIIHGKTWCPYCSKVANDPDYHLSLLLEIAFKKSGKLLSEKYINSTTKLTWQCDKGHIWKAVPTSIKIGQWCPVCAREAQKGDGSHFWKGGLTPLSDYLRDHIEEWKQESLRQYGYQCAITNDKRDLQIHHTFPFHKIRDQVLSELKMPKYQNIGDYTQEQLESIISALKLRHEEIIGIPLRKDIHDLFHRMYGRNNTTMDNLREFKARYLSGEFEGKQTKNQQLSLLI